MDREEAIDILNDERIVIWTEPDEEEIARKQNEAIDMAIEALSRDGKKYDAIRDELVALKNNWNEPIEVAMAYEKSIAVVKKYARMGESDG